MNSILKRLKINQVIKCFNIKSEHNLATTYILSNKTNKDWNSDKSIKYLFYLTSGYLFYKAFGCDSFPKVEAAEPISNLKGRRKQHNFIADVVELSAPTVVYIEIKDTRRVDFFTGKPQTVSNGSGFIIKEDGLILTNAHVVTKPHARVQVRLFDGTVYDGIVEDIDMNSDLATVRINAKNLPTMPLGNSADLKPGEFVVAIGSPLALSNTVTSGVVSSTHRGSDELGLRGKDMVYIQTDAAITFGNSGGPLVNLDGEAIGVNSMKVTAGISFAIPIDYVKNFLKNANGIRQTPTTGSKRKYMGITMLTLTADIIREMQQRNQHIPSNIDKGVLVWKVIYGSPAHIGGLQPGDIVIAMNEAPVKAAGDIYDILSKFTQRTLKMTVVRNGKTVDVHITPEDV